MAQRNFYTSYKEFILNIAHPGRRLLAFIVDIFLIFFISSKVMFGTLGASSGSSEHIADAPLSAGEIFLGLGSFFFLHIFMFFYYVLCEASRLQATPGKLLLKIKVVNKFGYQISIGQSIGRTLSKYLSGILGIGFLMILGGNRKQGLHDKLAHTYVVYKERHYID